LRQRAAQGFRCCLALLSGHAIELKFKPHVQCRPAPSRDGSVGPGQSVHLRTQISVTEKTPA
jgi:hypothetical protein